MSLVYDHPSLGRFQEQRVGFARYVVGQGAWMQQPIILRAMGGADPNCWVRRCSIEVLEILFEDQVHWTKQAQQIVMRELPNLAEIAPQLEDISPEEFWNSVHLESIRTDDDLNYEFKFGLGDLIADKKLLVCGIGDIGFEQVFLESPRSGY